MNPVKAIRDKCIDCMGGCANDVKDCTITSCAIHPFRNGKNPFRTPRVLTTEQRELASIRLAAGRAAKAVTF